MAFRGWKRETIQTDEGQSVTAIAPEIISASRSTDIPAFYASWFMDRLRKGYIRWINPFNGRSQYVSFSNTRLIVFWSKNPAPMLHYLDDLQSRGLHYLFHFTLNDYEDEGLEQNVPPLKKRISAFKTLSSRIGKERVLWRFDPLIVSDAINPDQLLKKVEHIGEKLAPYTTRLTISFLSLYAKVRRNLRNAAVVPADLDTIVIDHICAGLQTLSDKLGIDIVSCAEERDFLKYGIRHGSCIDPRIIAENFGEDPVLREFLGLTSSVDLFGTKRYHFSKSLKDPGQRTACTCVASKDIGSYDTCPHFCTYCYANTSIEAVKRNCKTRTIQGDSLLFRK